MLFFFLILTNFPPITPLEKMLKIPGKITGNPGDTVILPVKTCVKKCLDDPECLCAAWNSSGSCSMFKLVLDHSKSQQILKIVMDSKEKKDFVVVKASLPSSTCPSLSTPIRGSITPPIRYKNYPVTYNWSRTSNGWSIKQCSACVLSRTSKLHLCVKLHNSEQLNVNYVGGFSYEQAVMTARQQQKILLGVAARNEIGFVLRSKEPEKIDSYWIGGSASNCVNGVCTKITWSDGWTTTSDVKSVVSPVPNPCLAVVNGEVVGRDCNDKLLGALCAWKLL